jgi:hypothetical protein
MGVTIASRHRNASHPARAPIDTVFHTPMPLGQPRLSFSFQRDVAARWCSAFECLDFSRFF